MVRRAGRKHSPEWGTEGQQIGDEPLDVEFTSENERHLSNEDCAAAVWNLAWKALEIIVHPANKPTKFFNPNLKLPRMEKAAERLGNEWNGLKDYQLEGIGLLDASEAGERGIATGTALNDVMGLGKTLQIIALLELTRRRPVLIIGPALALETWKEEFHKWQSPVPKICHFHGKELAQQNANDLARFDVVLTSYTHVAKEFNSLESWMLDMKYRRHCPFPYHPSRIIKSSRTSFNARRYHLLDQNSHFRCRLVADNP